MSWVVSISLLVSFLPLICMTLSGGGSGSGELLPEPGALRLVGGRDDREGRVEMFYNRAWGTVCGDLWGDTQTKVVCRQLHFFQEGQMVLTIDDNPGFFQGSSEGPVHMDRVLCTGYEPMLVNCSYSEPSDCSHSKDIGVVCPGNCTYGDARLEGGEGEYEGRVEICTGGLWGTVCDNHWDIIEATVVCKQLDIDGKRPIGVGAAYFGSGRDPILMDAVVCTGAEENLTQCQHSTEHKCQHSEDVGVFCRGEFKLPTHGSHFGGRDDCVDNDIRFVGGTDEREGVVQVCYNGVWGAICDDLQVPEDYGPDMWHIDIDAQANVICRQLGYLRPNTSSVVVRGYISNDVKVPLLLHYSELSCVGNEAKLSDCAGYVIGEHLCSEPNGAVVVCPGNCTEGDVRLVGGRDSREGIVEMCLLGHWVAFCREKWSNREAEVVCRQLHNLSPGSISVAIDGHYFGFPQRSPLLHATCSSNEPYLAKCHSVIDQCDRIDSAGVICKVNCGDEETRMVLEDNDATSMCQSSSTQSPDHYKLEVVLAGTLTPLLLTITLLVVVVIILFLKLRGISSRQKLTSRKLTSSLRNSNSNDTSKTDIGPGAFEPQSPREQFHNSSQHTTRNQLSPFHHLKQPEPSLPHLYESLRGQKLWLSSPKGSELDVLEEERGAAAANCNDAAFNSVGNTHAYAILEAQEEVRCESAGPDTADSLPSLLVPSSIDQEGSADESAVSSAAAVLNFETNALPLPPKLEPSSSSSTEPRHGGRKKARKESFPQKFSDLPPVEKSTYDSLQPKSSGSSSRAFQSGASQREDRLTLSLKPVTTKTKLSSGPASQLKRLYSE